MSTCHSPDLTSTERAKPASGGEPGVALAGGELPAFVASPSHSKSFRDLIRPYGRGKGLSIAALRYEIPSQTPVVVSANKAPRRGHQGLHWGSKGGHFGGPLAPPMLSAGGRGAWAGNKPTNIGRSQYRGPTE